MPGGLCLVGHRISAELSIHQKRVTSSARNESDQNSSRDQVQLQARQSLAGCLEMTADDPSKKTPDYLEAPEKPLLLDEQAASDDAWTEAHL